MRTPCGSIWGSSWPGAPGEPGPEPSGAMLFTEVLTGCGGPGTEAGGPVGVPSRLPPFFLPNKNAIALSTGGRRTPVLVLRTRAERRREVVMNRGMQSWGSEYHVVTEVCRLKGGGELCTGDRCGGLWTFDARLKWKVCRLRRAQSCGWSQGGWHEGKGALARGT